MTTLRPIRHLAFFALTALATPAAAQSKPGPTVTGTAVAKVEVVSALFTTASCGKPVEATFTVKNAGAALSTKLVLSGVETAFTLAKDETKAIKVTGATLDCGKPISLVASIPAPAIGGVTPPPLFQRTYALKDVNYPQGNLANGDVKGVVGVTSATCGAPMSVIVKTPGDSASVTVTVSVLDTKKTLTLAPGTSQTVTSAKNLDCAQPLPQVGYYTSTPEWSYLAPMNVSVRP